MSLLQNQEFLIWQLRTSYLTNNKDGIGERLISLPPTALFSDPSIKNAGYGAHLEQHRTYSPPIPVTTTVASEYFLGPNKTNSFPLEDGEGGGMVTGKGSVDTVGPGPQVKRRRRREQQEEDDSSDLSDESDEDEETLVQQIKFSKMPVRNRTGSSPPRATASRAERHSPITRVQSDDQAPRPPSAAQNGTRQRRDTTTSSELSSEPDLDASAFAKRGIKPSRPGRQISFLEDDLADDAEDSIKRLENVEEESEGDAEISAASSLSSTFGETADSESLLDTDVHLASQSLANLMPDPLNIIPVSPRKSRSQSNQQLQALPPPRPVSVIHTASVLTQALKAQQAKPKNPLEAFVKFSGKGALDPLNIKIYAPFSSSDEPYELPLQKVSQDQDTGAVNHTSVGDAIGLCLWRYAEEGLRPAIPLEKQDVNWWTLRSVDDGEVDDDFPALNRSSNITDFTSNNNRPARARGRGKNFDEFAIVEATESQYQDNKRTTPKYTKMFTELSRPVKLTPAPIPETPSESAIVDDLPFGIQIPRPFAFTNRKGSAATLDAPQQYMHSTPRMGPPKLLKIHHTTLEALIQHTTIPTTTDTYLAEVLDQVCKRWHLDKAHHYFRVTGTQTMAPTDRTVETIGTRTELDLVRKRFANAGTNSLGMSPSSTSPNAPLVLQSTTPLPGGKAKGKKSGLGTSALNPLNNDPWSGYAPFGGLGLAGIPVKRWAVMRKMPLTFQASQPKIIMLDSEYLHILPSDSRGNLFDHNPVSAFAGAAGITSTAGAIPTETKINMFPFSMIVGCKVSRRHPKTFRIVVYRDNATKRYEFFASTKVEAADIVGDINKAVEPFMDLGQGQSGDGVGGLRERADT